jgi:UDP:flavonoid glycosyltransferase YjiC (YdhE family)
MIGAWSALVERVAPDAVVADHSPGLQVALYERGIPIVSVGSAFAMPPLGRDFFPPLRGDSSPAIPESRLLESLRRAQTARGRKPAANLLGPFRTTGRVIFGLPELDPYQSFRQESLSAPPGGLPTAQPWTMAPRVFVYVGADFDYFDAFAQALSLLPAPVEAYFRGESGPVPEFLRLRGLTVHETPPPLGEVLARCSHIITQGGAMTTAAAFAAGRPQLVIPGHDEADLNLGLLQRHGVAERLPITEDSRAIAGAITDFVNQPAPAERASEAAKRIAVRPLPDGADVAARAVRAALR